MDLTLLTDQEIEQNIVDLLGEKERRQRLNSIPGQIELLSQTYVNEGGDPQVLKNRIAVTPTA